MSQRSKSREKNHSGKQEGGGSSSRGYPGSSPELGSKVGQDSHYSVKVLTNSTGKDQGSEKAPVDGAVKRNQGAKP
ncbi:hypothetical protein K1719_001185 [Acacia pycnantha]|nr:hypothetical protein K1719_001185 [Acacia pycnantha]